MRTHGVPNAQVWGRRLDGAEGGEGTKENLLLGGSTIA